MIEREIRDQRTMELLGYLSVPDLMSRPGIFLMMAPDGLQSFSLDIGIMGHLDYSNEHVFSLVVVSRDKPLAFWQAIEGFRPAPNPLMEWLASPKEPDVSGLDDRMRNRRLPEPPPKAPGNLIAFLVIMFALAVAFAAFWALCLH